MTSDRTIQHLILNWLEARDDYERLVKPALQNFFVSPVWTLLGQVLVHIQSALNGIDWLGVQQWWSGLPLRTQNVLLYLGKEGWFFDMQPRRREP